MRPALAKFRQVAAGVGVVALAAAGAVGCGSSAPRANYSSFVEASGTHLVLGGQRFYFAGANADFVPHRDRAGAAQDLRNAAAGGFTVVRLFGFDDSGNPAIPQLAPGGYQYWSSASHGPAYSDGPAPGLGGLDYAIYQAHRDGLRLIVPLVNNWNDFGGMDAYVCWRLCTQANSTGQCAYKCFVGYHDDFYTDPTIVSWYKAWIAHVLNHVNPYTHIAYKDDPTILAWQLANEPRCNGSNATAYPRSPHCSPDGTILPWVKTMTSYVKTIDPHHLLAVGDEGFLCGPGATDYTGNCGEGDSIAYARVPGIDLMSFHDYPMLWNECPNLSTCVRWGSEWIQRHIGAARALGKPAVVDEFGLISGQLKITPTEQSSAYKAWTSTVYKDDGAGDLVWSLAPSGGLNAVGQWAVPCPSPSCAVLQTHASAMGKK
jgi:mannan endo-1,4-beta-mannosidase